MFTLLNYLNVKLQLYKITLISSFNIPTSIVTSIKGGCIAQNNTVCTLVF